MSVFLFKRLFTFLATLVVASVLVFAVLELLPVDFGYPAFAALLLLNGAGMGLFSSPNRAEVMNSLPAGARGADQPPVKRHRQRNQQSIGGEDHKGGQKGSLLSMRSAYHRLRGKSWF
jgi:hypothetical protein